MRVGVPAELEVQHHRVSVLRLYVVAALQVDLSYLPKGLSCADVHSADVVLVLSLAVRTLLLLLGEQKVDLGDCDLEADAFLLLALDFEYLLRQGM